MGPIVHATDPRPEVATLLTDPGLRLEAMDAARVDVQLVSPMPLTHPWLDQELAAAYVEATNAGIADLVRESDRLYGIGTVALQHPELAVAQVEHCVGELGLRGVQIGSSAGGRELDSPSLSAFWSRAEELGVVVVLHPWGCSLGERLADHYLANTVGNPWRRRWRCLASSSPGSSTGTRGSDY